MAYPRMTLYVGAFLRRLWPACRAWRREKLLAWVQWYVDHDRYVFITERRRLLAVALYRRLTDPFTQAEVHYADSAGPIVYCDIAASRGKEALRAAFSMMRIKEEANPHPHTYSAISSNWGFST